MNTRILEMFLRSNIEYLLDKNRTNPHELEKEHGIPQATVFRIQQGITENPRRSTLESLAKWAGVTPGELMDRDLKKDQLVKQNLSIDEQIQTFLDGTVTAITTDQLTDEERSKKIWIDFYDVKFCSGDGESIDFHFDVIKKQLSFEPSFFKKRKIKPENFKLIINKGDSNEEYLFDDDAIGLDISDTEITDGETYAIYFEGDALIRQIFKEQGGILVLHPRNPKYKDKIVNTELADNTTFKVFGRVRYRSG